MPQQKHSPIKYIIIVLVILILVGVGIYFVKYRFANTGIGTGVGQTDSNGFTPFGRVPTTTPGNGSKNNQSASTTSQNNTPIALPALRLLSNTPVGGYAASTTASTTVVRWVDRGRGNIYEAKEDSLDVTTLSNTVVPKIFDSQWNKNLTAFIGTSLLDTVSSPSTLYAELRARTTTTAKVASSTATSTKTLAQAPGTSIVVDSLQTPFELKGRNLPSNIITYAVSPKKDRVFFLVNENGNGVGYTATFDGQSVTQIFSTPVTQANAEWPEDNTITITTKGSASQNGFLYFVNPKKGIWNKILGPISGLSTRVSHDAKYVVASSGHANAVSTSIYSVATGKSVDAIITTVADKCVWGNFNKNMLYCAVPSQPTSATYPDDWYRGTISTIDKIWQIDATTDEIHLVTSIVDQSDRVIDAFNLGLDPKDEYLFFMNKNDLSLWSFDLVASKVQ